MIIGSSLKIIFLSMFLIGGTFLNAIPALAQLNTLKIDSTQLETLAQFKEATSVAVSPAGEIFVTDRGTSSIIKLTGDGTRIAEFGGPGQSEGQFDDPMYIDPTNGLILVVADAGNGRIQRFSREFLFLESLPVGSADEMREASALGQTQYRQRTQETRFGTGRPIAVATTSDNDMLVLDDQERVVFKWDSDRNLERVIGAYDQGDGALEQPVALALDGDGTTYVADRGLNAIQVYDAFGSYDRNMAVGLCKDVRGMTLLGDALFMALPNQIHWFHKRGNLEETWLLDLADPVIDIAIQNGRTQSFLYLLTRKSLIRLALN